MFLPDNIRVLLDMLNEAGFRAYAVGGCVRDSVMGQSADDYDITTTAHPEEIKQVFSGYRTIDIGEKHGTIVVISGGSPIEITRYADDNSIGTAICPYCGVDAVIGESSGLPITKTFLEKMHNKWF